MKSNSCQNTNAASNTTAEAAQKAKLTSSKIESLCREVTASGIEHVTLTTGHRRVSRTNEAGADIIGKLLAIFPKDGATHVVAMPGFEITHLLRVTRSSTSLLATVMECCCEIPVVTVGVGLSPEEDARLWQLLHAEATLPCSTNGKLSPARPWVAARLEIGVILSSPTLVFALGDFERCLAWAFVEQLSREARSAD